VGRFDSLFEYSNDGGAIAPSLGPFDFLHRLIFRLKNFEAIRGVLISRV